MIQKCHQISHHSLIAFVNKKEKHTELTTYVYLIQQLVEDYWEDMVVMIMEEEEEEDMVVMMEEEVDMEVDMEVMMVEEVDTVVIAATEEMTIMVVVDMVVQAEV